MLLRPKAPSDPETASFPLVSPEWRDDTLVEHAVSKARADPKADSLSMEPSDGGAWCECEACASMGSVSDRVVLLANEVAGAVNAPGLGRKYVGLYAYNRHAAPRLPPRRIRGRTAALLRAVQKRPAEHAAEVVRVVDPHHEGVRTRLELTGQVHVPLEPVVVQPPHPLERAVRHLLAIHVKPALIEDAREH